MRCANCNAENPEGGKFCLECGAALTHKCPRCGAPHPAAATFCGECGERLQAPPAKASAGSSAAGEAPAAKASTGSSAAGAVSWADAGVEPKLGRVGANGEEPSAAVARDDKHPPHFAITESRSGGGSHGDGAGVASEDV